MKKRPALARTLIDIPYRLRESAMNCALRAGKHAAYAACEKQVDEFMQQNDFAARPAYRPVLRKLRRNLILMRFSYPDGFDSFLEAYSENALQLVSHRLPETIPPEEPIVYCCVKDDLERMKLFYQYHRSIGFKHFVFIDNDSTDGTLEWMTAQPHCDVYLCRAHFSSMAASAWMKRLFEIYGYDRWYARIDSDECFSYPGMERHPVGDLLRYAEEHHIERVRAFLLDMYSTDPIGSPQPCAWDEIPEKYRYFDADSYELKSGMTMLSIFGGPRARVFSDTVRFMPQLAKYCLYRVRAEDLCLAHSALPLYRNFHSPCLAALRHYKFLPKDFANLDRRIQANVYANDGSEVKQYKKILEENPQCKFYYEGSRAYRDSKDLAAIRFLPPADFLDK